MTDWDEKLKEALAGREDEKTRKQEAIESSKSLRDNYLNEIVTPAFESVALLLAKNGRHLTITAMPEDESIIASVNFGEETEFSYTVFAKANDSGVPVPLIKMSWEDKNTGQLDYANHTLSLPSRENQIIDDFMTNYVEILRKI